MTTIQSSNFANQVLALAVDEDVNITKSIGIININDYIVVLEGVEHLIFNLLEGNDDGKFAVHEHSGDILLVSALDYEKSSDYMLNCTSHQLCRFQQDSYCCS